MTEIKLTLDDPAGALVQLRHAAETLDFCEPLSALADSIEEQVKPAEPIGFASVVREKTGMLFVRTGALIREPWESGTESREWSDLDHPEVLRVGIGETYPHPAGDAVVLGPETIKSSDGAVISHPGENYYPASVPTDADEFMVSAGFAPRSAQADEWRRLDVANAQTEAYTKGAEDFAAKVRLEICPPGPSGDDRASHQPTGEEPWKTEHSTTGTATTSTRL